MKRSYFPRSHLFDSRTDFLVNFSKPSSLDRLIIRCVIDKVLEKNITTWTELMLIPEFWN